MKKLALTNGGYTIVDNEDYKWLSQYKWFADRRIKKGKKKEKPYVMTRINRKCILIHRMLLNPPPGMLIDHKDGNPLNNTRANLRICTYEQNCYNQQLRAMNTSGYKGVYLKKSHIHCLKRWYAYITFQKRHRGLGYYATPEEAAIAYNKKATELFGEFANLNKIP
jgi:hypothetical protein